VILTWLGTGLFAQQEAPGGALDPKALEKLQAEYQAAKSAKRYDDAAKALQEMLSLNPNLPAVEYNLACLRSLQGQIEEALDQLNRAVDQGFLLAEQIEQDEDLAPLRTLPRFQEVVTKAKERRNVLQQEVAQALSQYQAAMGMHNYPEALRLLQVVQAKAPGQPAVEFALATTYAEMGKIEEGVASLDRAVALGFNDVSRLEHEPALGKLRAHPKYPEVVAKAKKLVETQRQQRENIPNPEPIFLPAQGVPSGEKAPLLIFLHGMGGSPGDLKAQFEPLAATGIAVFLPCGSIKLGVRADGKPAYNWEGLRDIEQIMSAASRLAGVRQDRIYVAGFSAGGSMCHLMAYTRPEAFAGVIVFSGTVQQEFTRLRPPAATVRRPPVCIVHGRGDTGIPFQAAEASAQFLKGQGFAVEVRPFDGGHAMPPNWPELIREVINAFPPPAVPPAPGT